MNVIRLKNLRLPDKAEVIEAVHGCGNIRGTGDHTEIVVAILVKTDYPDGLDGLAPLIDEGCSQTSLMAYIDKSFEYSGSFSDCYVLEFIKAAPLVWLDLSGWQPFSRRSSVLKAFCFCFFL